MYILNEKISLAHALRVIYYIFLLELENTLSYIFGNIDTEIFCPKDVLELLVNGS